MGARSSETPPGGRWEFWIDRGGTFTDCIARAPDGVLHTAKRLSSDSAPALVVREILERAGEVNDDGELPACSVKLGSTVATNALLERRGAETVLVTNHGFEDLLAIGTQERPELFELQIDRPEPLHREAIGCTARVGVDGQPIAELERESLVRALAAARGRGRSSLAVALIHAYAYPEQEREVVQLAREAGFDHVIGSEEIAREIGLLARAETAVADAYLTPLLRVHVHRLAEALPGSRLRFMQSSGGLTEAERFRGPNALLSGPAGGVVAAARVARRAGHRRAVALDMGGTSTDVSLITDGEVERSFETLIAGVRVRAPMLRIHTVAAGGGSLCRFDGFRLTVGPESAGSEPGPLCYGRRAVCDDGALGPRLASELALTDVNLALGRVQPDRFPFEVDEAPVRAALDQLCERLAAAGFAKTPDEIAAGFVQIANASMAQAIAQVSVSRGVDPRDHVLVGFGGAGGQHVCAIARLLGIRQILLHPFAGLLSAYGIGVSDVTWDGQWDAGRERLAAERVGLPAAIEARFAELVERGRVALAKEHVPGASLHEERWLDLRYEGSETPLSIREPKSEGGPDSGLDSAPSSDDWCEAFEAEHRRRFGYERPERSIEVVTARVRVVLASPHDDSGESVIPAVGPPAPVTQRTASVYFDGTGRVAVPVYNREDLVPGCRLEGPALILEATGTVALDPSFELVVDEDRVLRLEDREGAPTRAEDDLERSDPVRLEVFGNRFMSMAEQMGAVLRNTAVSTNIKERLDYSCAVFDREGGLVANAPHIPVHLGAMGATVRAVQERFPRLDPGDVIVTNDPTEGGSHLPDVTVVTPVFIQGDNVTGPDPDFYVASRGHHADLGGTTPGSMPPDSTCLEEEGVVIRAFKLVSAGRFDEARIRSLLTSAEHPARRPEDNIADLVAMVAANRAGERLLADFVSEQGMRAVALTMGQLQAASAAKVAREISALPDGTHRFVDALDDGTPVCVSLRVEGESMCIDFEGTGAASTGNLNAPAAVVQAAVIYVLRALVAERIPLNGGCLRPVEVRIPTSSLLDPPADAAVVGGNVETSQRIVDVLLGALGRVAASQGTMNNVTFGNEHFGYYETIGGGSGAGPDFDGASGVHTHMTNTRITDPEILEARYPVRLEVFAIRRGSGGAGLRSGGDGLVRQYRFLEPVIVSLLTERRERAPWGLAGGGEGEVGRNVLLRSGGEEERLPGKCSRAVQAGDGLRVETPGGGGWGKPGIAPS